MAIGRPPIELTPELRARVFGHLRSGHFRKDAARLSGISHTKFNEFLNDYPDFAAACKEAELASLDGLLATMKGHAADTWQACAWLIERRSKAWRSPDTKLREKMGKADAAAAPAPPDATGLTLAQIERELAVRRGMVRVIEEKPVKDDVDLKLLAEYRGDDEDDS